MNHFFGTWSYWTLARELYYSISTHRALWKCPESCKYVALSLPKVALRLPKVAGGVSKEEGGGDFYFSGLALKTVDSEESFSTCE